MFINQKSPRANGLRCAAMTKVISMGSGECHLGEHRVVMVLLGQKLCIVLRTLGIFLG